MNGILTAANITTDQKAGISPISIVQQVQSTESARKSTLNRPFICPILFPRPDAICVTFNIKPVNEISRDIWLHHASESFYVRLVADGIDATSALCRVFDGQLAARSFPEAEQVIWICTVSEQASESGTVELIGSGA